MPEAKNVTLEAVRGLAALLVVAGHARYALYSTAGIPLEGRSKWEQVLLLPSTFGRVSVALFFVISGYLVGGQVLRQVSAGKFDGRAYVVKRFSRLWPVLAGGIAFTAAVDALSRAFFTNAYTASQGRFTSSFETLLCNAAFLQHSRCHTYGTNESLWSIGYEFFYYMVFALAVVAWFGLIDMSFRRSAVALAFAVGAIAMFGLNLFLYAPAWLIGAAVAQLHRRDTGKIRRLCENRINVALSLLMAVCGLLVSKVVRENLPVIFLLTGLLVAPAILVFASVDPVPRRLGRRAVIRLARVGEWSYTLYMFHLPLAFFLGVVAFAVGVPANPGTVYALFLILPVLVYPFFLLVEARTPRIRSYLLKITER